MIPISQVFTYTGTNQTFPTPAGVSSVSLSLIGGSGGTSFASGSFGGGAASFTVAKVLLPAGTTSLLILVGSMGLSPDTSVPSTGASGGSSGAADNITGGLGGSTSLAGFGGSGGGGYSAVYAQPSGTLLALAAGGGGAGGGITPGNNGGEAGSPLTGDISHSTGSSGAGSPDDSMVAGGFGGHTSGTHAIGGFGGIGSGGISAFGGSGTPTPPVGGTGPGVGGTGGSGALVGSGGGGGGAGYAGGGGGGAGRSTGVIVDGAGGGGGSSYLIAGSTGYTKLPPAIESNGIVTVAIMVPVVGLKLSKSFSTSSATVGQTVAIMFTVTNSNPVSISNASVTDILPAQLQVNTAGPIAGCGGALINTSAPNVISITGISLGAGSSSCNFLVTATVVTAGNAINRAVASFTISDVTLTSTAMAILLTTPIITAPLLTKVFVPAIVSWGGQSRLIFTLTNGSSSMITGITFSDPLPSGVRVVAAPVSACGGIVTVSGSLGSQVVSLSGASLAAGASCQFSAVVQGVMVGKQINITSPVTAGASAGSGAQASLMVLAGRALLPAQCCRSKCRAHHY